MRNDVVTKRPKRTVIQSEDDIAWEIVYAKPSKETVTIYTDLMLYLYRYGVRKGVFANRPPSPKPA